ncbi:MAG TPA: GDP-mannose 4,6-dehydratase [Opitutaceae bacterium]|nr:GDP-mannose 4,6-dehydratase [Opitutaceae bacterium]
MAADGRQGGQGREHPSPDGNSTHPMAKRVLITGGAGFIGSHLADDLLRHGYAVRALDCLSPQVHGSDQQRPQDLDPQVELVVGDVRDGELVRRSLRDVDAVVHLAARVGLGQSMYQIAAIFASQLLNGKRPVVFALAREILGHEPQVSFEEGLDEFTGWLETQVGVSRPSAEIAQRGLTE